ncbi:MAG: CpaF family protein [Planktotalea sp.]|uniref:CpaF family protein n=1 Tax=Planktotalea sp. TaxID=2029877 RepID=UPI003C755485
MTLHISQPSVRTCVQQVLEIARQIDPETQSAVDRANAALSYIVENSSDLWPMALQRQVLSEAALLLDTESETQAPVEDLRANLVEVPKDVETIEAPKADVPAARTQTPILAVANDVMKALAEELDYADLAMRPRSEQEAKIKANITKLGEAQKLHFNARELAELIDVVLADLLGLGPLEQLLADDTVTDIMVNGPDQVFVERAGQLTLTSVRFRDNAHVLGVASRIVAAVGRRIDESQPMVDARLADGSRVNVAVPPLAIDGPTITIRKFPSKPVKLDTLIKGGSLSAKMGEFLGLAASLRLNILVSGGTGSGKTTLINAMSEHISAGERIITIEDAAELRFQQPHVVRFETRPPNVEGTGEVTMRTLMRNALRMRPDRIIIGEIRGDEVLDLLQAMNTGHDGSMSTLHANSPREALTRVESMAALAGFVPGPGVVRRQLVDAVNLIVQVSRMRDGKRRVTSISEVAGLAGDVITLQDIFTFQVGPSSTRKQIEGEYVFTGYRPKFASRASDYGRIDDLNSILGGA